MEVLLFTQLIGAVERRMTPSMLKAYARDREEHLQLKSWAKLIRGTDPSQRGGYGLIGDWVSRGWTPIESLHLPDVALVSLEHTRPQSRSTYQTYHIAVVHSTGIISLTDIGTDSRTPGWAHRIMPAIAELLRNLDDYNTTHTAHQEGPWSPNSIPLTWKSSPGWY